MTIAEPWCTRFPGDLRLPREPVLIRVDKNTPDSEPYITTKELAERFSLKTKTIRDWNTRYADFPSLKMPGEIRIRVSDFLTWIEQFKRVRSYKVSSGTGEIETTEVK